MRLSSFAIPRVAIFTRRLAFLCDWVHSQCYCFYKADKFSQGFQLSVLNWCIFLSLFLSVLTFSPSVVPGVVFLFFYLYLFFLSFFLSGCPFSPVLQRRVSGLALWYWRILSNYITTTTTTIISQIHSQLRLSTAGPGVTKSHTHGIGSPPWF